MPDSRIKLSLPFPPSTNTYWRHIVIQGRPRTLLSDKARKYRQSVQESVQRELGTVEPQVGRLSVTVDLLPPDKRKRDVDNYLKGLLDALTHSGVWGDDEQIDRLTVSRGDRVPGGRVDVWVAKI